MSEAEKFLLEGLKNGREAMNRAVFECWCWQHSYTGCFTNRLFDLIQKADMSNRAKLRIAFPEYVWAFEE